MFVIDVMRRIWSLSSIILLHKPYGIEFIDHFFLQIQPKEKRKNRKKEKEKRKKTL